MSSFVCVATDNSAERCGRVVGVRLPQVEEDDEPWTVPPSRRRQHPSIVGDVPQTLQLVVANEIYVSASAPAFHTVLT